VGDPGPTPLDLLAGSGTAPAVAWPGDWNRYAAWLFSVCLRRRLSKAEAADAVQEVLLALARFRRLHGRRPGSPLRPWLIRVLRNKIGDLHRDRAQRPEAIPDELLGAVLESGELGLDFAWGRYPEPTAYAPILDRVQRRCAEPKNWRAFQSV